MEFVLLTAFLILVLSMFLYPLILRSGFRETQKYRAAQMGIGILTILIHGGLVYGWVGILIFMGISIVIGSVAETLGVKKGWVFGKYRYSDQVGPKLYDILPIFAPLMWCVISYMGFSMTDLLFFRIHHEGMIVRHLPFITAPLVVAFWDMIAEPIAVDEGRWKWKKKGRYYGIPWTNFVGWIFTASMILAASSIFHAMPHGMVDISPWIRYLPAFGYCIFTGICAKVCIERNLILPGLLGIGVSVLFMIVGVIEIGF